MSKCEARSLSRTAYYVLVPAFVFNIISEAKIEAELALQMVSFIFAAATIWNENLMHLQSYSWIIGMFISSLTYYLLASR